MAKSVTGGDVRIGVVGCGLIAQLAHLPALTALHGRFTVVALADPSPRVRSEIARRYRIAHAYERHEHLLERAGVDAVLVSSPNGTHAQVTLDALAAGVHVLVEKPVCLTAADAARIVELAARTRRVVQVGYMKRFDAAFDALRESLPEARELKLVSCTTVDPGIGLRYRPSGLVAPTDVGASERDSLARATREQVAEATGSDDPRHVRPFSDAFLGALVHDVNLVLGLLGDLDLEPGPVLDAAGAADGSLAYGACGIGSSGRWSAAWMLLPGAAAFREEVRLFADDGVRTLSFAAPYDPAPASLEDDGHVQAYARGADSYARQLMHFHDCVTGGAACRTPAEQGARDVALLTELYRAAVAA